MFNQNRSNDAGKVIRVAHKYNIKEAPSDYEYWQSRPAIERIAALESIRAEYITWKYGTNPGFSRVYKIVKR